MFAFIDESGDSGLRGAAGQSRFFCAAMVIFTDEVQMHACDQRINELRHELRVNSSFEFHFRENSDRIRRSFLDAVSPFDFSYHGFIFDKQSNELQHRIFDGHETVYTLACRHMVESAEGQLHDASVIIDKSGSLAFQSSLARFLKGLHSVSNGPRVHSVKSKRSSGNNLLQLVDYVVGTINRMAQGKKSAEVYRHYIRHKEKAIIRWP